MLTVAHLDGLEEALLHGGGTHNLADVFADVRRGTAQLWAEERACIVTRINDTPNDVELHFWLATGILDDVVALSNKVIEWGRSMGCTVATLNGRRGWTKPLADEGWEPRLVTMSRRL